MPIQFQVPPSGMFIETRLAEVYDGRVEIDGWARAGGAITPLPEPDLVWTFQRTDAGDWVFYATRPDDDVGDWVYLIKVLWSQMPNRTRTQTHPRTFGRTGIAAPPGEGWDRARVGFYEHWMPPVVHPQDWELIQQLVVAAGRALPVVARPQGG